MAFGFGAAQKRVFFFVARAEEDFMLLGKRRLMAIVEKVVVQCTDESSRAVDAESPDPI